jgi:hypothetical protein
MWCSIYISTLCEHLSLLLSLDATRPAEPVFVDLLKSPGIDIQHSGPVRQPYLSYRPARPHRLADSVHRNRFLASINDYKYGLRRELPEDLPQKLWAANGVWVRHCGHVCKPSRSATMALPQRSLRHFKLRIGINHALTAHRNSHQHRRPQHTGDRHSSGPPPLRPAAQDPFRPHTSNNTIRCLTVFPGKPARFFVRPESTNQSRYP